MQERIEQASRRLGRQSDPEPPDFTPPRPPSLVLYAILFAVALALVAITVVTSVHAVGTILVVALLVTPALAAAQWADRVVATMVGGALVGAVAGVGGIAASAQSWREPGTSSISAPEARLCTVLAGLVLAGTMIFARMPPAAA